eukprot:5202489-Prymnesium_polylepis.1
MGCPSRPAAACVVPPLILPLLLTFRPSQRSVIRCRASTRSRTYCRIGRRGSGRGPSSPLHSTRRAQS